MSRGCGKTHQLIRKSAETGNYIVCANISEAHYIQMQSISFNYVIPLPITYDEFINKKYHSKNINGFLIDNVDNLLEYMSNVPINTITITP